ncbi:MAG: hypothetical protein M3130_03925 [Actinomycetota bacterium]|nr:hypothetical protein [Actinomycetota bacterium]
MLTPVGPLMLLAASLITPAAADNFSRDPGQARKILEAVAGDRARSGMGGFLIVAGLVALLPGLVLVVSRVTERGSRVATIGGTLAMVGVSAGAITNTFFFHSFALTDPAVHASPTALAAAFGAIGPVIAPFFISYAAGTIIGFTTLAVAVFRGKRAPWWAALVLGLAGLATMIVNAGTLSAVVVSLMLLVGLLGCGILRTGQATPLAREHVEEMSA